MGENTVGTLWRALRIMMTFNKTFLCHEKSSHPSPCYRHHGRYHYASNAQKECFNGVAAKVIGRAERQFFVSIQRIYRRALAYSYLNALTGFSRAVLKV